MATSQNFIPNKRFIKKMTTSEPKPEIPLKNFLENAVTICGGVVGGGLAYLIGSEPTWPLLLGGAATGAALGFGVTKLVRKYTT